MIELASQYYVLRIYVSVSHCKSGKWSETTVRYFLPKITKIWKPLLSAPVNLNMEQIYFESLYPDLDLGLAYLEAKKKRRPKKIDRHFQVNKFISEIFFQA